MGGFSQPHSPLHSQPSQQDIATVQYERAVRMKEKEVERRMNDKIFDCQLERLSKGLPYLDIAPILQGASRGATGGGATGGGATGGGATGGGAAGGGSKEKPYFQRAYLLLARVGKLGGVSAFRIGEAMKVLKKHVDALQDSVVIEDYVTDEDAIDLANMMLTFMDIE